MIHRSLDLWVQNNVKVEAGSGVQEEVRLVVIRVEIRGRSR